MDSNIYINTYRNICNDVLMLLTAVNDDNVSFEL